MIANLRESYFGKGTSEERILLHKNNHRIDFGGTKSAFNAEVFLYPVIFTAVFFGLLVALNCKPRYNHPATALTIIVCFVALLLLKTAYDFLMTFQRKTDMSMRAYYFCMFSVTCFLGYYIGGWIYDGQMFPYYSYQQLKVYRDIDPKTQSGLRYTDGGVVYFTEGTTLKRDMNACLKNDNHYCVAPIVKCPFDDCSDFKSETGSYDYFAVGRDCCGCPEGEFRCGAWNNPLAHGGLRLLGDEDLLYYRLAVKQWEAQFGLTAKTPLFFHWDLRPQQEAQHLDDLGYTYIIGVTLVYGVLQIMLSMLLDSLSIL